MRSHAAFPVLLALLSSPLLALPSRVFVKSTGMDVGSCPITAPCRSFAYAIGQVAASGEVIALDAAGYGTFVVTQSVSVIAAPGATAFIAVNSGAGIDIAAPVSPTDVIVLRGLALTGSGGNLGIRFVAGHSLAIENCIVSGFATFGVLASRNGDVTSPNVRIEHSTIRSNNVNGVVTANIGAGLPPVGMTIAHCTLRDNGLLAVDAEDNARVVVTDSVITDNGTAVDARVAVDNSAPQVDVERCSITGNGNGVVAESNGQNPPPVVRIAHNVIAGNDVGVSESNGIIMTMTSAGVTTNTIVGSIISDGTLSGSYTAK